MIRNILDFPFGCINRFELYKSVTDSKDLIQRFQLLTELDIHNGCVNTISWSEGGEYLLSGSDDLYLNVTCPYTFKKKALLRTGHTSNIFSTKFLPSTFNRQIVSCAANGCIIHTNLDKPFVSENGNKFLCHIGTTYEIRVIPPDPSLFLSCGEDGTVRLYDLRAKSSCSAENCREDVILQCPNVVSCMCVNPMNSNHLAIGCGDSSMRIYDRRMLGDKAKDKSCAGSLQGMLSCSTIPPSQNRTLSMTSLVYNKLGTEILVSYSAENIYLYKLKDQNFLEIYDQNKESKSSSDFIQFKSHTTMPPTKRLRVRGDWADTGPHSRPENERNTLSTGQHLTSNVLRRMGDFLSGMIHENATERDQPSNYGGFQRLIVRQQRRLAAQRNPPPSFSDMDPPSQSSDLAGRFRTMCDTNETSGSSNAEPSMCNDDDSQLIRNENTCDNNVDDNLPHPQSQLSHINESSPGDDEGATGGLPPTNPVGASTSGDEDNMNREEDVANIRRNTARSRWRRALGTITHRRVLKNENLKKEILCEMVNYPHYKHFRSYKGHRNCRTMIKEANFWGEDFIISGSDCGHIFFWDKNSSEVVKLIEADKHVVNCVQPHPFLPILATSGIDYDVKLWAPIGDKSTFDKAKAEEIMHRNEMMLSESMNTVNVPASLVIRMLQSFHQLRAAGNVDNSD